MCENKSNFRSSNAVSQAFVPPLNAPPISQRDAPKFHSREHRNLSARAFESGAYDYHKSRPSYPTEALDLLESSTSAKLLDVGCGTGKLTEQLKERGHHVLALDPSEDMVRTLQSHLAVPAWIATAENTSVKSGAFDAITCAQTWHWLDAALASQEFDRITGPLGQILLIWNTLDVSIPWVHRLSRIMHSGDTLKEGFTPTFYDPWFVKKEVRLKWSQPMTTTSIHLLTHTRSYWLRSSEKTREKVTSNLSWYLNEHLGFSDTDLIELPYRCDAFLLSKA
ncbi:class I SAM-dependent methyltransferase [Corynebacterium pseudotuberculosis]|uniref:class I SAM-dependent methyltransferase n=1 Tax=Corynebacterium pseudotuberculosis TaxID=1719 RepID=UPI0007193BE1|nr:class I SAM-dependent methyltransferase [Corynebacterium pseudotuberculosis]ALP33651.1 SAM-dependent methyltransferase [Corynebacterium pseudotuberculosis]ALR33603.1 SAM-dependent methyltransferase [Corynebacterium pseudotuberculosis]APX36052.1 SAM-dependent methyltransferase [Corynebacterium pseudotuberculosis]APX38168.1 SAM-dependent methyltransferase [Corynebacterium pseudotuberculosis]AQL51094.1 hypothetical protein CpPA04_0993 [Corynebacterium pseudotuberculosis]